MKIQVAGLSEGLHHYRFGADGPDLRLGDGFPGPVEVQVTAEKTGNQIFLSASIGAEGVFACDRCLMEFRQKLTPGYRMNYVLESADANRYDPSEVQVISPAQSVIDIVEDVRQTILLSVPLKLLCGESCKGLCPVCGKNRNLEPCNCRDEVPDSRWDELKRLQTEN
jgi:uncharacterized protein